MKEDLKEIFKLSSTFDAFDNLLESTSYNFFLQKQIKKEQLKIMHLYTMEKNIVKQELENFDISTGTEDEIINNAILKCNKNSKFNSLNETSKKAIIIEVLSEMSEII
ncbi:hypothetical protein [Bacillus canaveralius]|uniref:hypothetical protein n=1 Tax=Bacillus canaveralius TaxID=1403243 RepID=UPI000F78FF33|nr:hypothetical protein [Bacillus canaveralius]RSK44985.1 hypothetical protein EJA13_20225 [Bacillus canaveralius]